MFYSLQPMPTCKFFQYLDVNYKGYWEHAVIAFVLFHPVEKPKPFCSKLLTLSLNNKHCAPVTFESVLNY